MGSMSTGPDQSYNPSGVIRQGNNPMLLLLYLAYGEGQTASTAGGVFLALLVATLGCLGFIFYGYKTYPSDRN